VWLGEQRLLVHRINLSTLTARLTTINHLQKRVPDVGWAPMIDDFAIGVIESHRRGEPFELIGQRPPSERPTYLLSPVVRPGLPTLIFGPGGEGKTTIAMAVAVSVATGASVVPGWVPEVTGPVLALDFENDAERSDVIIRRIATGAGIAAPLIHYRRCYGAFADQLEEVADFVSREAVALVLIDPVAHAEGTSQGDPREGALRMFDALRQLGTASLLIDHVAGAELASQQQTARPYGSIFKVNLSREVFELRAEREPIGNRREVILRHTKSNYGAHVPTKGLAITHTDDATIFEATEIEAADLQPRLSFGDRMFRELRSGPLDTRELSERLGVNSNAVRTTVGRDRRFTRLDNNKIAIAVARG